NFNPPPKRLDDKQTKERFDPNNPSAGQFPGRPGNQQQPEPGKLTAQQIAEQVDKFLLDNGVLVRVNDAGREHGQIRAFNNRTFDTSKVVLTAVLRNEDYGRIARILADGQLDTLELNIQNQGFTAASTAYNDIAEI